MKIVCALVLTGTFAASALAGDSAAMHRDRLIICNQFVIEDPYPAVIPDSTQHCCRTATRPHDCRTQNPHEEYRGP
jgi:hypothetical protein